MDLFGQRNLGIVMALLLVALVVVKRLASGSIFDKPQGGWLLQLVNIFNLFFLLVVNPLTAALLIARRIELIDATRIAIGTPWVWLALEIIGLAAYVKGFLLMAWALVTLGRNYQLGGSAPREEDGMVTSGPYQLVRHPMYAAALAISLGLACLTGSWAFLAVFFIYLALIIPLISREEKGLHDAYGERYDAYRQKVKKLIPFFY
ncbi:MAG TPA: isoprenylcysteine carboxylmethyltransferase family protein [Acidobacteriota bacterium]